MGSPRPFGFGRLCSHLSPRGGRLLAAIFWGVRTFLTAFPRGNERDCLVYLSSFIIPKKQGLSIRFNALKQFLALILIVQRLVGQSVSLLVLFPGDESEFDFLKINSQIPDSNEKRLDFRLQDLVFSPYLLN